MMGYGWGVGSGASLCPSLLGPLAGDSGARTRPGLDKYGPDERHQPLTESETRAFYTKLFATTEATINCQLSGIFD